MYVISTDTNLMYILYYVSYYTLAYTYIYTLYIYSKIAQHRLSFCCYVYVYVYK